MNDATALRIAVALEQLVELQKQDLALSQTERDERRAEQQAILSEMQRANAAQSRAVNSMCDPEKAPAPLLAWPPKRKDP